MASTRYVSLSSSLVSPCCMVDVGWGGLCDGGWTLLYQDDGWASPCMSTADRPSCFSYYRLYSKGRVLGHKRGKRNTHPTTSLLQIEGVANKTDAQFYLGKVRTSVNPALDALR
jgi:hypothetical protein